MLNNGLIRISVQPKNLKAETAGLFFQAPAEELAPDAPPPVPETFSAAALRHLATAFSQPAAMGFQADGGDDLPAPDLVENAVEESALTKTTTASFKQMHRRVPIYGGVIGVEMAQNRDLLNLNGHLAASPKVSPIATISAAGALEKAVALANLPEGVGVGDLEAPELAYWFLERDENWHLGYIFHQLPVYPSRTGERRRAEGDLGHRHDGPVVSKVVVDAHSGEKLAVIPLRFHLTPVAATGLDADGTLHRFTAAERSPGSYVLEDPVRRIKTFSMGFQDINQYHQLPGASVGSATPTFSNAAAVVAHANASKVYDFFRNVLKRDSIDGRGMAIISAVECVDSYQPVQNDPNGYRNAAFIRATHTDYPPVIRTGLMVYGQTRWPDQQYHSFAESLDVVAHELTHGVTDYSGGLDYVTQSGALNESMSDIFGVVISNAHQANVANWDWAIGEEADSQGRPTRNVKSPRLVAHPQPDHMDDFMKLKPYEEPNDDNDQGYVHSNSGIHNRAAYLILTSPAFTWQQVIQIYYLTLTTPGRLNPRSSFSDSRAGIEASCHSLFRNDPSLPVKLQAVRAAFDTVGIA